MGTPCWVEGFLYCTCFALSSVPFLCLTTKVLAITYFYPTASSIGWSSAGQRSKENGRGKKVQFPDTSRVSTLRVYIYTSWLWTISTQMQTCNETFPQMARLPAAVCSSESSHVSSPFFKESYQHNTARSAAMASSHLQVQCPSFALLQDSICTGSLETGSTTILWEEDKQLPLPCCLLNKMLNSGTRAASGASNLVHFITMDQLFFSFWDVKTQHSSGRACLAMKPFCLEVCEERQLRMATSMVLVVVSVVEHSKAYSVPWIHMVHWAFVGKTGHAHLDGSQ